MNTEFDTLETLKDSSPQIDKLNELIDLNPGAGQALIDAFHLGVEHAEN